MVCTENTHLDYNITKKTKPRTKCLDTYWAWVAVAAGAAGAAAAGTFSPGPYTF